MAFLTRVPLLEQRSQISCEGPDSPYFRLCSPQGLCHKDPTLLPWPKGSRAQDGNEQAWPCSNRTPFMDTNVEPRMPHKVLFNHLRETETILSPRATQKEAAGGPGPKAASPGLALDSGPGFLEPGKCSPVCSGGDFTAKDHRFQSPLKQT